jgi:hypothetical protein
VFAALPADVPTPPALHVSIRASKADPLERDRVVYSISLANDGDGPVRGAVVRDAYRPPGLRWTVDLPPRSTRVLSYLVVVDPDASLSTTRRGDGVLRNRVASSAAGSDCPPGATDSRCLARSTPVRPVGTAPGPALLTHGLADAVPSLLGSWARVAGMVAAAVALAAGYAVRVWRRRWAAHH